MLKPAQIKKKIKGTQNIEQVTKAMERVSSVKMRRAQQVLAVSKPFSQTAIGLLNRLQKDIKESEISFYKSPKNAEKLLVVLVTSDRGFCGAFNGNILRFAQAHISSLIGKEIATREDITIVAFGKKGAKYFKKLGFNVTVEYSGIGDYALVSEALPLSDYIKKQFSTNEYKKVLIIYPEFINSLSQKPKVVQYLPLIAGEYAQSAEKNESICDYAIEPSSRKVLERIVDYLVDVKLYYTILQSNASEHSARMIAMRNASSNAKDLIKELNLTYNKSRQTQITTELSEIVSAKEAIES